MNKLNRSLRIYLEHCSELKNVALKESQKISSLIGPLTEEELRGLRDLHPNGISISPTLSLCYGSFVIDSWITIFYFREKVESSGTRLLSITPATAEDLKALQNWLNS